MRSTRLSHVGGEIPRQLVYTTTMLLTIATIISMLIIGWVVWITLQRQEAGDEAFQDKLKRDDERAQQGREGLHDGPKKRDKTDRQRSG